MSISTFPAASAGGGGGSTGYGLVNTTGIVRTAQPIEAGYYQITFVPETESIDAAAKIEFTTTSGIITVFTIDLDSAVTGNLGMNHVNLPNGASQITSYLEGSYTFQKVAEPLNQQDATVTVYRSSTSVTLTADTEVAIVGGGGGGEDVCCGRIGGGSGHAKQFTAMAGTYTLTIGAGGGSGGGQGGSTSFGAESVYGGNTDNSDGSKRNGWGGSASQFNAGLGANGQIAQYGEAWPGLFTPIPAVGTSPYGKAGGCGYGPGGNGGANGGGGAQNGVDGGGGGGAGYPVNSTSGGNGVCITLEWS